MVWVRHARIGRLCSPPYWSLGTWTYSRMSPHEFPQVITFVSTGPDDPWEVG